ncbi:hypothetical protein GGQ68_004001 [Sagittula marina]|uniref:DUF192 domain-containing protein n=1 Tax=Sagittula marina TaxID=943940 RepID=A0A7W6DRU9_9RHOB|nr:DUF192 domain-containing protein [Sagittula marina]MBB3987654.1 hypothetical protein [Sagittula marina]
MGSRIDALKTNLNSFVAAALVMVVTSGAASAASECRDDVLHMRGDFGEARFTIDVADTGPERNRGLMFVEKMPASYGMLFVFERPRQVAFWMKNTLIPLDMIFADAAGVVQNVHVNAVPGDLTSIPGKGQIKYVFEINGGLAPMLGIGPGTQLRHPAIDGAAWACE